jgi:hypothetical protein
MQRQPIAVVVVMQTGGGAPSQFQNYDAFLMILNLVLGMSAHRVALETFDSRPEEIWNFPPQADGLRYAFSHVKSGDRGAAMLDALNVAIEMLEQQPAGFRRIIVLLSQPQDLGSKVTAGEMLRLLGENNITIYSLTFTAEPLVPKTIPGRPRVRHQGSSTANHTSTVSTGEPRSVDEMLSAIRDNTAAEVAALSGGSHLRLEDPDGLQSALSILGGDFANSYLLSFRPVSPVPGFHSIQVDMSMKLHGLAVVARGSYWLGKTDGENR